MTQVISSDALARAPKVVKRVTGRKVWTMTDLQGRKPNRFLILLDMDDIIADCIGGIIAGAKAKHGLDLSISDFVTHDTNLIPKVANAGIDIYNSVIMEDGFFANLNPLPGAQKYVELIASRHDVVICSSPTKNPSCIPEKNAWLDKHFPYLINRIYTKRKDCCVGDIFIEDRPSNLESNNSTYKIAIQYPFNLNTVVDLNAESGSDTLRAWSIINMWISSMSGVSVIN
jgi:5'(3')-deoxyribonucleotidase